ncbi:MAG: TetR/AcrR family transcriptional regulator [Micrococcales bacterium]|nr:TetR/AcrR family transcriptional regulator [Micrococcales bacterium]
MSGTPTSNHAHRDVVLETARLILADNGVKGLTIEGVSARTGVAKTTIYRRFRSKQELALAVVRQMTAEVVAVEQHGNSRARLVAVLERAVTLLRTTVMGKVMKGLVSDIATDPELGAAYHREVISLRVTTVHDIVQDGVASGELKPETDAGILHELLFGAVYYRLLLNGGELESAMADRIVDAILPAFLIHPSH